MEWVDVSGGAAVDGDTGFFGCDFGENAASICEAVVVLKIDGRWGEQVGFR